MYTDREVRTAIKRLCGLAAIYKLQRQGKLYHKTMQDLYELFHNRHQLWGATARHVSAIIAAYPSTFTRQPRPPAA